MMSEQEFYLLNGNQYRGSRYSNFAGAGIDPQGNVSSAVNENSANQGTGTSVDPTQPQVGQAVQQAASKAPTEVSQAPQAPASLGKTASNLVIGAALPAAGSTIGGVVGANLASGNPALSGAGTAVKNKISAGLLGGTAGNSVATNAALGSMGGNFGPATSASVSKAASGASLGGAAGVGLGSFASTLLTGGSVKQAAASGIGSAAGFYIGNMILPGVGGFIGSTLGSMVSGLFGGKEKRVSLGVGVGPDAETGQYKTYSTSNKGSDEGTASKYADNINQILNTFSTSTGIKYITDAGFAAGTNIGNKDPGSFYGDQKVSQTPGDAGAVALAALKDPKRYTLGNDTQFNEFWGKAVNDAKSITDLGDSVDSFYASRGLMGNSSPPSARTPRMTGERASTFYG